MIDLSAVEKKIGYTFKNKDLLLRAMTHSSYAHVHNTQDNERLEFLGDAVLDYLAALVLFETFPDKKEGEMTKIRASLVKEETLSEICDRLGLTDHLLIATGNQTHPIKKSNAVKCDLFEALIGAILLDSDKDLTFLKSFLNKVCEPYIYKDYTDYKSNVLELCMQNKLTYEFVYEGEFSVNQPVYCVQLFINGKKVSGGTGKNKKSAEQEACKYFYKNILHK